MRIGSFGLDNVCVSGTLDEEEKAMFDFKEHKWIFFQENLELYIRDFPNLGAYIFGIRIIQMSNVELGEDNSHKDDNLKDRLDKLMFGFPSIKIPKKSESFFWWMKGNNFGFDNMVNGDFNAEELTNADTEGQGLDGGPFMIFNKNQKDSIIISPFSTKEKFQNCYMTVSKY